ncbi:MAG: FAD-dependent oxidoreductase [Thermomicrobiales bacterium]|nr:FAD-dependent oxidoreductase [Thermomicrobiales bacterium]MCO5222582.1 FAD-dependent oxidoreductase [Thermomicrobiales bacterium]
MHAPIVIAGGGMAGLACASLLIQQNQPVVLFEASDRVGGRVRTDIVDGYRIDRGFQVIPAAYPALAQVVSLPEIGPRRLDTGAIVWDGRTRHLLQSPFSDPKALPGLLRSGAIPLGDKIRLARLAARCRTSRWESAAAASVTREGSESALALFEEAGFSSQFITRFAKPFWGGITLDPSLSLSAGPVLFTLKMFAEGAAVIPEEGMQALPQALAVRHPDGLVRLSTPVESIVIEDGKATGVIAGGETIAASAVVVATDAPAAKALTGIESIPTPGIGCTTVYLAGSRDPGIGKTLLLNGSGFGGVNHIAPLSNVAPSYAPQGRHLIAAVLLDTPDLRGRSPESLNQMARADAARMLGQGIEDWEVIGTVTVPFAQFRQPPGFVAHLPRNRTETRGLYLAGEYTVDSSINGAITSGLNAAGAILRDQGIASA